MGGLCTITSIRRHQGANSDLLLSVLYDPGTYLSLSVLYDPDTYLSLIILYDSGTYLSSCIVWSWHIFIVKCLVWSWYNDEHLTQTFLFIECIQKKHNRENCWLCSHFTDGKTLKMGQINGFVEYSQLRSAEWSSRNRLALAKPSYQHSGEEQNRSAKHQHHATKTRDANSPRYFRKLNKGSHGDRYVG